MKNKIIKLFLLLSVILSTTLSANAFSFRNMTLDIVQVSDTHISTDRSDTQYKALSSSRALLSDIINQINDIKGLDFVLFTGDMVDSATIENFEAYYKEIENLKYPSLNAFGNHEFYGDMTKDEVLSTVQKYNKNYTFNDTYYAISPKTDYRIIVLDSTIKENTSQGELSAEQLKFLDDELAQNQDKIVVIAMHHPSVEPFVATEHSIVNAQDFNNILLKYKNPIIVLTGHYHAAKIRHFGNLVFVSTPAVITYPMAARHIKITNFKDRVIYKFDFIETTLEDVKELNRQNVISYSMLLGSQKDREDEFTFYKKHPKSISYKKKKIEQAARATKTSKKELKKYEKMRKKQAQKELQVSDKKIKKEKKEKIQKEKPQKVKKEKKSFFKFKKRKKPETIENQEATIQ